MKASELRIGNLIVESLSFGSDKVIKVDSNIFNRRIDEFIPIPLTEEWLFKFGFEWKGNKFLTIFTPCGKALAYVEDNFFKFIGVTIEIQIKYVHQLQNLYFALTGEELVIKE